MFVGHFGAAFAAKRAAPRVSLGTLFLSFQFADLLWPILLLAGPVTVALEGALYAGGIVLYLGATRASDRTGNWALWTLIVLLGAGWAFSLGTLQPLEETKLAWGALSMGVVVPWGYWIDPHRMARR